MPQYFISRTRKNEIKDIVLDILQKSGTTTLPIDLGKIVKHFGIHCIGADKITTRNSAQGIGKDGYILQSGTGYVIVYNPSHIRGRIRFTIACQLAHIFLGHLAAGASDKTTDIEAAYFADELLMPLSVLDSLGCRVRNGLPSRATYRFTAGKNRLKDFARQMISIENLNGETE